MEVLALVVEIKKMVIFNCILIAVSTRVAPDPDDAVLFQTAHGAYDVTLALLKHYGSSQTLTK